MGNFRRESFIPNPLSLTARHFASNWLILRMGCTVPISLFAYITETRTVFGRIAAIIFSGLTTPSCSTGTYVTSILPRRSNSRNGFSTDACSMFVVTTCGLSLFRDELARAGKIPPSSEKELPPSENRYDRTYFLLQRIERIE